MIFMLSRQSEQDVFFAYSKSSHIKLYSQNFFIVFKEIVPILILILCRIWLNKVILFCDVSIIAFQKLMIIDLTILTRV